MHWRWEVTPGQTAWKIRNWWLVRGLLVRFCNSLNNIQRWLPIVFHLRATFLGLNFFLLVVHKKRSFWSNHANPIPFFTSSHRNSWKFCISALMCSLLWLSWSFHPLNFYNVFYLSPLWWHFQTHFASCIFHVMADWRVETIMDIVVVICQAQKPYTY